jgi:hypothetical protein
MRNEYEQVWLDVIEKLRAQGKVKHDAFIWRRLVGGSISGRSLGIDLKVKSKLMN